MASSDTVTVACGLPHGLRLQLHKLSDVPGGHPSTPIGDPVVLNGGNHSDAIAGWGLTENVDKEFIQKWLADNKDLAPVRAGLIMVREKFADAIAQAKENKNPKTGFEALDPNKAPAGVEVTTKLGGKKK